MTAVFKYFNYSEEDNSPLRHGAQVSTDNS